MTIAKFLMLVWNSLADLSWCWDLASAEESGTWKSIPWQRRWVQSSLTVS